MNPEWSKTTAKANWPIFRSLASFQTGDVPGDLIAGLTLAAIAIPEQMATARLGSFSPQIGFFAFIAGSLGFAVLGSNRFLSCGADSTITPIFAGGLVADGRLRFGRTIRRLQWRWRCWLARSSSRAACSGWAGSPICCRRR